MSLTTGKTTIALSEFKGGGVETIHFADKEEAVLYLMGDCMDDEWAGLRGKIKGRIQELDAISRVIASHHSLLGTGMGETDGQ